MVNVEGILRSYLQESIGVPVYVSVPENPPARFATVERTGGAWESGIHETATVIVDYWGDGRGDSYHLADSGDTALRAFERESGIARVEPNATCVHYPDVISKRERYESTYQITTYKY